MNTTITLPTDVAAALRQALNDAVLVVEPGDSAPPPAPTPTPIVPQFFAPQQWRTRMPITTLVEWKKGTPSFYSGKQMNDGNVWLIGFTAGTEPVSVALAEYAGPPASRLWALVDNERGVTIATGGPTQTPMVKLNGTPSRFDVRYVLVPGRRYTLAVVNALAGVSSGMVGQFYF